MTDVSSYMSSGVSRPRGNTSFSSNITLADLGRAGTGSTRRFPKHPFLVPAVAEQVRNSKAWRDVVQVVPGEADTYCAEDIRQNGGIVLTSDSDLLMEDLGPHGSVAFFWEIGTKSEPDETELFALTYSARQLAAQLGLQDVGGIPRLAFEMTMRHTGLDEALHFAKARETTEDTTKENYQKFLEEHLVPQEYISADHPVISLLTSLDPRISELVIQSLNIDLEADAESSAAMDTATAAIAAGQPRGPDKTSMFLPVMVEDNARKSSWTTSESVRQLCYAIAQQKKKEDPRRGPQQPPRRDDVVIEYRTLESSTGGRQMSLPSPAETESGCAGLLATLEQIELGLPGRELLWLALAVHQDVDWSTSNGRHPLSVQVMGEASSIFLNPKNNDGQGQQQPGQYGWDVLHFTAQVQASLYSLRMLKQVLDIVSALADPPLSQTQEKLQQRLSNLPLIADWPTAESIFGQLSRIQRTGCLSVISKMLDIAEFEFRTPSKNKTSQSDRKRGQSTRQMPPRSLAVNPFAVLSPQAQEE